MFGREPSPEDAKIIDLDLVLHAEHSSNASTFAARVAEAHRLDPKSVAAFEAAQASRAKASGDLRQTLQSIEAMWRGGNDAQALAEVDRAIATYPKSAQAYALRASIYLARHDDGRAQADIRSATGLAKNCELRNTKQQTYALTCP